MPAAFVGVLAFLAFAAFTALPLGVALPAVALITGIVATARTLFRWRGLISLTILVILFVPMRRYALPGALPFELELYRVVVAIVATCWATSLLIDPRVRLRHSTFDKPIALFIFGLLASILANPTQVNLLEGEVVKRLSYFASFLIVLAMIICVTRTVDDVDKLLKVLVAGGAVIAVASLYEARTGYNVFNQLGRIIPILNPIELPSASYRQGLVRAMGSSQHPIELGAVLVMLVPPGLYLARRTRQRRWYLAAGFLALATLATVARTSILMLAVAFAVFLWLRPAEVKRLLPVLVPVFLAAQVAMPGSLGTIKQSFFPEGGLLAEQESHPGWEGSGRLADLGPSLAQFARKPLFGQGFGTRIVDSTGQRHDKNSLILDDQWLGSLLEIGLAGTLGLLWIFWRAIRRMGRAAKEDRTDRGWALAALTASISAFGVGMVTFDAFSFVQVTFLFFILLALGGALLQAEPEAAAEPARVDLENVRSLRGAAPESFAHA
jgi:O-antigen ligase/polysaccharide polymerase Wzy-like membrane protein